MLMRDAEKSMKILLERGDKESKEIIESIQKLVSEIRVLRSQGRRLKRNKRSLCIRIESLTAD